MQDKLIILLGLLCAFLVTWVLAYPDKMGICPPYGIDGQYECVEKTAWLAEPLLQLFTPLFISFVGAMFVAVSLRKKFLIFASLYSTFFLVMVFSVDNISRDYIFPDRI